MSNAMTVRTMRQVALASLLLSALAAAAAAQAVAANAGNATRTWGRGGGVGAFCRIWNVQPRTFNRWMCRPGLTCCNNTQPFVFPKAAGGGGGVSTSAAGTTNNFGGGWSFTWGTCHQCCETGCTRLLTNFNGASTISNALLMSTLVADVTVVQELLNNGQDSTAKEAELKRKWATYGADEASITITPFCPPAGSDASITVGATFTAGQNAYVIVGWFIGFNDDAAPEALVPFQGDANQQVRAVMYQYYQFIETTGFIANAKTLAQNRDVVFAGLSAGAAVSQFAALEFNRVKAVFLYGVQRIGNAAFQTNYATQRGAVTSSWWNKFDAWPIVPVANNAELDLLPADGIDTTVEPTLRMLDPRLWWRVDPYTSACERMTAALATPCARAGAQTCTLNVEDHEPRAHFNSIRACLPPGLADQCFSSLRVLDP